MTRSTRNRPRPAATRLSAFQQGFEHRFEQLRGFYHGLLGMAVKHAVLFLILFMVFCIGSFALLYPWLGQDFFPTVDGQQFEIHMRASTGTRIEEDGAPGG